ncbi:heptaprenyl diphosphate synthase, partial [Lactobacillus sp. XV13L]|nr:heptaprenyl diphosphate synthase [Lactobacillus sp. XV13L]
AAAGAFISLFLMKLFLFLTPRFVSLLGVSIIGGVSHNFGQLVVAVVLAQSKYLFLYLPLLTIFGILAGIVVGLVGSMLVHYADAFNFIRKVIDKGN